MADISIYNVPELAKPAGHYCHVARVRNAAERLYIAGMVANDASGNLVGEDDFDAQATQVFRNIEQALRSSGASWRNVVQFTTYLTRAGDVKQWRAFREREFAKWFPDAAYPPNTLLIIDRLAAETYLIEVQTIAEI
ncbi:MAG: RidA family protein [Betaproteobacteria bacterium]|nr:MAG: RidA family protein [Betaproteobacteria bacterium]